MENREMSFEQAMERLNEIVDKLEGGQESLEESLALFEEGSALSAKCLGMLEAAEQKMRVLGEGEKANGED